MSPAEAVSAEVGEHVIVPESFCALITVVAVHSNRAATLRVGMASSR
jgi:hypothetical protein